MNGKTNSAGTCLIQLKFNSAIFKSAKRLLDGTGRLRENAKQDKATRPDTNTRKMQKISEETEYQTKSMPFMWHVLKITGNKQNRVFSKWNDIFHCFNPCVLSASVWYIVGGMRVQEAILLSFLSTFRRLRRYRRRTHEIYLKNSNNIFLHSHFPQLTLNFWTKNNSVVGQLFPSHNSLAKMGNPNEIDESRSML